MNLSRLVVEVTLVTVVGDDDAGHRIMAALRGAAITVHVRESANGSSGT